MNVYACTRLCNKNMLRKIYRDKIHSWVFLLNICTLTHQMNEHLITLIKYKPKKVKKKSKLTTTEHRNPFFFHSTCRMNKLACKQVEKWNCGTFRVLLKFISLSLSLSVLPSCCHRSLHLLLLDVCFPSSQQDHEVWRTLACGHAA